MKKKSFILFTGILGILFSSCSTSEKKEVRDEQLCYLKITQGEVTITEDENLEMLIDSLVMNLHIKNDSVAGTLNWLPAQKDKMTGTLIGTIHGDVITAIYTYAAEGITAREEKILKLDSNRIFFKTGDLEEINGIWTLKDKDAPFSESIPKMLCQ